MAITFNTLPATMRVPGAYAEVDGSNAVNATPARQKSALLIGIRRSTGTVAEAVPTVITRETEGDTYFGVGSMLAEMCRYFKRVDRTSKLTAIALNEAGGGTAAAGVISTAAATATSAGTVYYYIGDRRIAVPVVVGDTRSTHTTALIAAINADTRCAFTAAVDGVNNYECDLTARHTGAYGNQIKVAVALMPGDKLPTEFGLGATTITQPTGGATDPTMSTAIAAFPDETFDVVITGWCDDTSMDALETEMGTRWGALSEHPGLIYAARRDSLANITTAGNARNSQYSILTGYNGHSSEPYKWAAQIGAASCAEAHPARPRNTLALPDIMAPQPSSIRFDTTERNTLLTDGVSTWKVDSGGRVLIERLVTTYQTNSASLADPTYLDETTMLKLAWLRYSWRFRMSKYARFSIADDGTVVSPGTPVTTPSEIRGDILDLAKNEWIPYGIMEGGAKYDTFAEQLVVERNSGDVNRVDIQLPPDLTNDLHVLAAQIAFRL
jgi:phage tail sheath gpL-like